MRYKTRFSLSLIACVINAVAFATPSPYPNYQPATGVSKQDQITMEARWLHLNATRINGVTIPKSFNASGYWPYMSQNNIDYQQYRQHSDKQNCVVNPDHSNDATIERAMHNQGLDIYDGAVWQIALALASTSGNASDYTQDIEEYKNFLLNGFPGGFLSYYTAEGYTYNGKTIPLAKNGYLLKFISPTWANNYDSINDCNMQWPEWSAVTGEEAWAAFIGPIQSIYLLNDGANNKNWSASSQAGDYIQLGKNALGAIQHMQDTSGGVYRNVALREQAQDKEISLENNFSLYAGLTMLEQALKDRIIQYRKQTVLNKTVTAQLKQAIHSDQDDIDKINKIKTGMVSFFAGKGGVSVFDKENQFFYASVTGATPNTKDFAVDVQSWGTTVFVTSKKDKTDANDPDLLQAMLDSYGPDFLFNMFESTIKKSAYLDTNQQLMGVGYTAQQPSDTFYELSGEWTLGAINAAIVLADYYKEDSAKSALLISQAQKLLNGVAKETSSLEGNPQSRTARLSYLYANKRAFIPFGWYSNKMPSTASTAWSLMVNACFNPLELGGGHYEGICKQLKLD